MNNQGIINKYLSSTRRGENPICVNNSDMEYILHQLEENHKFIAVTRMRDRRIIDIDSILFFKTEDKYITVQHDRGIDLITDTIYRLEEEYKDKFIRVHRNCLVNKKRIERITPARKLGRKKIYLKDYEQPITVSRRYHSELLRFFRTGVY